MSDKFLKKEKSVLVLTTSFPVHEEIAVGIHVLEMSRHLLRNGVKVNVLAPNHYKSQKREDIEGIKVYRFSYFFPLKFQKLAYGAGIPTNIKKSLLAKLQLPCFMVSFFIKALILSKKADIIHCHWSIAGFIGVLVSKLLNKKSVLMMHGAEVFVMGSNPLLKFVLKNSNYLIFNSTFTEEEVLKIYPVKCHKVISPGVNLERFYPQNKVINLRSRLNIPEKAFFILTIGKFIPRKGIEYLIKAMHILINDEGYSNLYLRIGGRGPLKDNYQKLIDKYRINKFIEFTGYIPDEDIPTYYTNADIFVLPSIIDSDGDTEGLGVVFLEANACGTPVIGSSVGGIKDVIKDGYNGYLVEQKNAMDVVDKIKKLINNRKLREDMAKNGIKNVKNKFNWENVSKEIIKVYQELG